MSIDFVAKSGMLFVPQGQCPDMGKAIDLFRNAFPEIQFIETMSGLKEDTKYRLTDDGWISMIPSQQSRRYF